MHHTFEVFQITCLHGKQTEHNKLTDNHKKYVVPVPNYTQDTNSLVPSMQFQSFSNKEKVFSLVHSEIIFTVILKLYRK